MRIISSDNASEFVRDGVLPVGEGWTLAPSALEYARRNGLRLAGSGAQEAAAAASAKLAVLTVEGMDKPGIVAAVAAEVSTQGGNITDLSQTVLAGVFVMVMVVDMSATDGYEALSGAMERVGQDIGVDISVRLYSVFEAMHRI